jgi:PadR family transcriptional regulator AphA
VELTAVEAAVLGLLAWREASGYDLSKAIENTVGYFWTTAPSRVYAVLQRLHERGLVARRDVAEGRRPPKALYRPTERGREELLAWLAADADPDALRSPFLLRLFLGEFLPPARVRELVEERRRRAEELVAELERVERELEGVPEELHGLLTAQYGLARARATIAWADDALARLPRA